MTAEDVLMNVYGRTKKFTPQEIENNKQIVKAMEFYALDRILENMLTLKDGRQRISDRLDDVHEIMNKEN